MRTSRFPLPASRFPLLIFIFTLIFTSEICLPYKLMAQFSVCAIEDYDEGILVNKYSTQLTTDNGFLKYSGYGKIPTSGNINSLVVFVKFKNENYEDLRSFEGYNSLGEPTFNAAYTYASDTLPGRKASGYADSWDIGGHQSWSDNPISEWPFNLPMINSRKQQLPNWANSSFIDDFNNTSTTSGSMTDILYRASNGMLNFRGQIYEWTYVPQLNSNEYTDMSVLVNEILDYIRNDSTSSIDIDNPAFDLIKSNSFNHESDGIFDMLMLNFRFVRIRDLDTNWNGLPESAGGITNLMPRPSFINGSYNFNENSGIINSSYSKQGMIGTAIHELGHRILGSHPVWIDDPNIETKKFDNFSIMQTTPQRRFHISIRDKIGVGWGNVLVIDLSGQNEEFVLNIYDSYRVNNSNEYDIIVLKRDATSFNGAIVIEAIHKSHLWLNNTDSSFSDGDGSDVFMPNEGLLIYKLLNSSYSGISSMHSSGIRRSHIGINDYQAFGVGDSYNPFSIVSNYSFNENALFDKEIAITDITKTSTGFSFKVHKNFLKSNSETKKLTTRYSFNSNTVGKPSNSTWELGGRFTLTSPVSLANFTLKAATGSDWNGLIINEGNGSFNGQYYFTNATIAELKGNTAWSQYPGQAVISVYDGQLNLSNVNIHSTGIVPAIGATHLYGTLQIQYSDIHTQIGTGLLSTSNGVVFVRHTEISSSGTTYPLVHAKYGGMVSSWLPPWISYGYQRGHNELQGGSSGIESANSSIVRFGESYYSNDSNYFFDSNSKKIKVTNGGTAHVNYNYWNNYSPTLINQGGIIYYSYSSGNANGSILGSGGFMNVNNENRESLTSINATHQSDDGIDTKLTSEKEPWGLARDKFNLESQGISMPTNLSNDVNELSLKSKVKFKFYGKALQKGVLNFESSQRKDLSKLDEETKSHILFTATQISLSQGDTIGVRNYINQKDFQVSESWKGVFDNLATSLGTISKSEIESEIEIESNIKAFPNPFNPSTTIQYLPRSSGKLILTIYNVLGQKVVGYQSSVNASELFNYNFDASQLATGLYIVQIELGKVKLNSKLYLIK